MPTPHPLSSVQARQLDRVLGLLQGRRAAQALIIARRLAAEAPYAPDALHVLALAHGDAGNVADAEEAFARALELAQNHPLVLVNFGTFLRRQGRRDEAMQLFDRAAAAAPDFGKVWIELGLTALDGGQASHATSALSRAVALQPDSALAWHGLGNARRALGDLESAADAFRRATVAAPGYAPAWVNLGAALRLLGRSTEAITCFERAAAVGYSGPELMDALAGALVDVGRSAKAMRHARQLIREHPHFAPGHVTLARMLWEYGPALAPEADPLEAFRDAVRNQPDNRPLQMAFARFLLEARQAVEALGHIRALRATADHPILTALEANALELLGRPEQSGPLYEQVHRMLGSSDPGFLNAYARHLLKAGKWDAAAQRSIEATRTSPTDQEAWAYLTTAWRLLGDQREFWVCDYDRLITLVDVEPPQGFADTPQFLAALKSTLDPMHQAQREPVQQSLRGGSQTPGRLFGRADPLLAATRDALTGAVQRWLRDLPENANHPFLSRRSRGVVITGSWSVKLWSSGSHVNHIHPEGWMSSAFYVSLPPSVAAADSGCAGFLQFGQPPVELGLDLPPRRVIHPQAGRLALFPSFMWHGTMPFQDDASRMTIAFDMLPQPTSATPPS